MKHTAITVLIDFCQMAENEIRRIKTGYAPGPSMRDCVGQWEAAVREARQIIDNYRQERERWLANPDGPQAG